MEGAEETLIPFSGNGEAMFRTVFRREHVRPGSCDDLRTFFPSRKLTENPHS